MLRDGDNGKRFAVEVGQAGLVPAIPEDVERLM